MEAGRVPAPRGRGAGLAGLLLFRLCTVVLQLIGDLFDKVWLFCKPVWNGVDS
jgi:hypothetical protein